VKAGAAQLGDLDDRGLEPQLGRADGRHVAPHAAAENDYVVFAGGHGRDIWRAKGTKIQFIRSPETLLPRFLRAYPYQPATAFWRAYEISHLASLALPEGLGLDLGCGDGLLTGIVLELTGPRTLIGVDLDPEEVRLAEHLGIYERVHATPASEIPEPDSSVDWILSNSVLEHIDPLAPVLDEVARLLRTGGRFIFTVPSQPFHEFLRGPLRPGASRARYLEQLDRRLAHRAYLAEEGWSALLAAHGLRLERATSYLSRRQTRRWETISRLTAGVLYSLWGRRSAPIDIQRRLGVRRAGRLMPAPLAAILGRLLRVGIDSRDTGPGSCLLIVASKG
jgi:SAM-dependent methyltransferase